MGEKKTQQIEESLESESLYLMLTRYLIRHRNEAKERLGNRKMMPTDYIIRNCQSMDHFLQIKTDMIFANQFISEEDEKGWWKSNNQFGIKLKKINGQLAKVGIKVIDGGRKKNKRIKIIDYTKWAEDKDEFFWKID